MRNRLKKPIKMIINTNKNLKFYIKYYHPGLALLLTLITAGQFYSTKLNENDLKEVVGKVASIKKDKYRHHKYTDDRITIYIEGYSNPFYFFENNTNYFNTIMENVTVGEIISIKHRTKLQSIIGTGSEFKIFKLSKKSIVLYSFESMKKHFRDVGKFGFWVALGLWILYIWMKIKYKVK